MDQKRCQGHGRCYASAPELFVPDDVGDGREFGAGIVSADLEHKARVAVANCPELAITGEESS